MNDSRRERVAVAIGQARTHEPCLQFACAEALRAGRPIQLVHVAEGDSTTVAQRRLNTIAEDVQAITRGMVPVETLVGTGPVVPTLIELSKDVDLLVLQRRQLSRLRRQVTGSLSAQVAGQAHTPTVSVPEGWRPRGGDARRVTLGFDGADSDERTRLLRHAFARASERQPDQVRAELTVVHAWHLPSGYDDAIVDQRAVREWRDRYEGALHDVLKPLQSRHGLVATTVDIQHLEPAEALIQAARDSDLVVLARGRLEHPLVGHLGSVARAVLRDAACPVEVINEGHVA